MCAVVEEQAVELTPERAHRRRAAHLYGLIVCGSVLAAAPEKLGLVRIALAVTGTLLVYWAAETYAFWTAARMQHERRHVVLDGLPLVAAGLVPVLVLLGEAILDVKTSTGVDVALVVNIALLIGVGWNLSSGIGLTGARRVGAALSTGLLGVAMIALKLTLLH
jgi:hypothetical protein